MEQINRKGARSKQEIPEQILKQLNSGEIESANLVEWLAVDQKFLLKNFLLHHNKGKYIDSFFSRLDQLKKPTVNSINEAIGVEFSTIYKIKNEQDLPAILLNHKSDMVRCWAAYSVAKNTEITINELLKQIKIFAMDHHFGVREIAWLSVRPAVIKNLEKSIQLLSKWTSNSNENIRRFASEVTRPRGVWCSHIPQIKENPEICLNILVPLKADTSKYVRDSVGNWLNDASKSRPDFVKNICNQWETESPCKETQYIIKKAMRSIKNC